MALVLHIVKIRNCTFSVTDNGLGPLFAALCVCHNPFFFILSNSIQRLQFIHFPPQPISCSSLLRLAKTWLNTLPASHPNLISRVLFPFLTRLAFAHSSTVPLFFNFCPTTMADALEVNDSSLQALASYLQKTLEPASRHEGK